MRRPFPCLWFDGDAEEAANFYTSLLPGSSIDDVWRSPADTPSGPAGMVLTVDFTLGGQRFQGSTAVRTSVSTRRVVAQASDPATIVPSTSTYTSAGPGLVGRGVVDLFRSEDDGRTWSGPLPVTDERRGHQFFPDVDAYDGVLGVLWQDSREDPAYSVQRPIGNTANATSSGDAVVNTYLAASEDGTSFGQDVRVSSVGNQMQYEMFASANVPFYGDYNWLSLVAGPNGVIGYGTWTDNRDVVPGPDPREATQDDFDVKSC